MEEEEIIEEESPYVYWGAYLLDKRKAWDRDFLNASYETQIRMFNNGLVPASWFGL